MTCTTMNLAVRIECQANSAKLISQEDGLITISDDKSLRVWLKRENGQFWPSVCHYLPTIGVCLEFNEETKRVFIGFSNGLVKEYSFSEDYNSVQHLHDYHAHTGEVTCLHFAISSDCLLTASKDKTFQCFNSIDCSRYGQIHLEGQALCMAMDAASEHVFVGDYSGAITMIKVADSYCTLVTTLKGHEGSVRDLCWDPTLKWLMSCSFDESVIIWDIGGQKGISYELRYHKGKVVGMAEARSFKKLMSVAEDRFLVVWDLTAPRKPTPAWEDSDTCQQCAAPFFWSFKTMYQLRKLGARQHHCRKCGKALCESCCSYRSILPKYGYEMEIRLCQSCHASLDSSDTRSTAKRYDVKHMVTSLDYDEKKKLLLTSGSDRSIKLWDVSGILGDLPGTSSSLSR